MLAIQKRAKYFSKVITMPNGVEALVVFELIEKGGKTVARAVSGKLLNEVNLKNEKTLCLSGIKSPTEFIPILSTFDFIDFINLSSDFSFMTCLKTRAPNLN